MIDFTMKPSGSFPAPFRDVAAPGVQLDSWDTNGPVGEYEISEVGLGYRAFARTDCTIPASQSVSLSLLVNDRTVVEAYDSGGINPIATRVLASDPSPQPVTLVVSNIVKVRITPDDPVAYLCTLDWTLMKKKAAQKKSR